MVVPCIENLLNIAVTETDLCLIDGLKINFLELVSLKILPYTNILVLKFISYYNSIGDSITIDNILNFIFKLN
jgi:hypothetical protein